MAYEDVGKIALIEFKITTNRQLVSGISKFFPDFQSQEEGYEIRVM